MIKPGVNVAGLKPEIVLAYSIAQRVYQRFAYDCVITSGLDGKHKKKSRHYEGYAIDLRVKNMPKKDWVLIADRIRAALGNQYDVVLETNVAGHEHIHIEFDPKD